MLRVFQNFEWEVPISEDRDGGGAGRGKNDEIEDLGNGGQQLRRCKFHGFPSAFSVPGDYNKREPEMD